MYAGFDYYQTEYRGVIVKSADDYNRAARKACRQMDILTTDKLQFAFPTRDRDAEAVKDCECELSEFLYRIEQYQQTVSDSTGLVSQDGIVRGKIVKSITSGSESISYSASESSLSSMVSEAAKDKKIMDAQICEIIKGCLLGIVDANGINLLYAGSYPGERCIWE